MHTDAGFLTIIRPWVERFPLLARLYRSFREEWRRSQADFSRVAPIGFKFEGNEAMRQGTFEPEEIKCIKSLLSESQVFVDIGANIGLYTCIARSMGKEAVAIEPVPENLWWLYMNLSANGWENTEVFPLAVSTRPHLMELFGDATGASAVAGWANQPKTMKRFVPCSTFDKVVFDRIQGRKALIKIDVEGGELSVLQGAVKSLASDVRPTWLIEVCYDENHPAGMNPNYKAVFDLMFKNGYKVRNAEVGSKEISREDIEKHTNKFYNYIFY